MNPTVRTVIAALLIILVLAPVVFGVDVCDPISNIGMMNMTMNMTGGSMNQTINMTAGTMNMTANMTMNQTAPDYSWNTSYVTLSNGTYVKVNNGSYVQVTNGSYVQVGNNSYITVSNGSVVTVGNGSYITVSNNTYVKITNTSYILASGIQPFTAVQSVGGFNLSNVKVITGLSDAANKSYAGTHGAATSITNGATINHLLGITPTGCQVQPTVANTTMAVTAMSSTTLTVASWRLNATNGAGAAGAVGISQTVYWECWL